MRISAINNVSRCANFKSTVKNNGTADAQKRNEIKKHLAMTALAVLGIAFVGICLNKNEIDPIRTMQRSKRRDAKALERYRYDEATKKMMSLHKKFLNGEFDKKSPKVMEQIKHNGLMFERQLGILRT